ncbi:MAG: hypothetical protein OXD54_05545 [Candidatus Poribacteria bacterium]|nr:hypothetical protein [Candidatus Poribacteria bacterium]
MEGPINFIMFFLSIVFVIFWMVVFWRIMRAHEKLAESVERYWQIRYRQDQRNNASKDD